MTTRATPITARGARKTREGIVVSNKMSKTIVVRVSRLDRHPQYNRVIKRSNTFKVHDETNRAAIGDVVSIMETRPISKDKHWRLVDILKQASSAPPVPDAAAEILARSKPSPPAPPGPASE